MVAGREATPSDAAHAEKLKVYWTVPGHEGYAKVNWGVDGDYNRCVVLLTPYVGAKIVHGLCQNYHIAATGFPAGHAPGETPANHHH